MAIVLWIGIVITAQAFQATPSDHAPAVAIGLFPAIAAWGLLVLTQSLGAAGVVQRRPRARRRACSPSPAAFAQSGLHLDGLVALAQGFMVTCMVWSAMSAHLIDRQFRRAIVWAGFGASSPSSASSTPARSRRPAAIYDIGFGTGWRWAIGYPLCGFFFLEQCASRHAPTDTVRSAPSAPPTWARRTTFGQREVAEVSPPAGTSRFEGKTPRSAGRRYEREAGALRVVRLDNPPPAGVLCRPIRTCPPLALIRLTAASIPSTLT